MPTCYVELKGLPREEKGEVSEKGLDVTFIHFSSLSPSVSLSSSLETLFLTLRFESPKKTYQLFFCLSVKEKKTAKIKTISSLKVFQKSCFLLSGLSGMDIKGSSCYNPPPPPPPPPPPCPPPPLPSHPTKWIPHRREILL